MNYRCARCGKTAPVSIREPRCGCGGLWKLDFEPQMCIRDRYEDLCGEENDHRSPRHGGHEEGG